MTGRIGHIEDDAFDGDPAVRESEKLKASYSPEFHKEMEKLGEELKSDEAPQNG